VEVGGGDGELPVAGTAGEKGGDLRGHGVGIGSVGICGGSEGGGRRWDREKARRGGGGGAAAARDEKHGGAEGETSTTGRGFSSGFWNRLL
jgi:hypothetical protein